jgi:CDGSH-type Zn-finger protein
MSNEEKSVIKITVVKGKKYSLCTCGISLSLPYCDNQHRDYNQKNNTNYKSLKMVSDSDGEIKFSSSLWKS